MSAYHFTKQNRFLTQINKCYNLKLVPRDNICYVARHKHNYYRRQDVWSLGNGKLIPNTLLAAVHSTSGVHSSSRRYTENPSKLVLGIESSCDDTGAAIVNENGSVIGEALNSQTRIHVEMGGILPPIARDLHKENIQKVVEDAMSNANLRFEDLDAIAVTNEPGLPMSLSVGLNFAKKLIRETGKPFIPVHHMEAHALTARMMQPIPFPFLVLLISGGHCLLAVVRGVQDFLLLGRGTDDAPGDAFDKTARELKLKNLTECSGMSGGQAIELMAKQGDPKAYELKNVMGHIRDCNFSFSGIKASVKRTIKEEEIKFGIEGGAILPSASNICASFQYSVLHHLAKRLQRAIIFCDNNQLLPDTNRTLVVSGGVASNQFLRQGLQKMCAQYDCDVVCPPPPLCTDNGIMIAWNGMEKLKLGVGIASDPEAVDVKHRSPLGEDMTDKVQQSHIKLFRVKLL